MLLFLLFSLTKTIDWKDEQLGIQIKDERLFALNPAIKRYLFQAQTLPFQVKVDFNNTQNNLKNVRQILQIMNITDWDYIFPVKNKIFTFEDFIQAVAQFNSFCGESQEVIQSYQGLDPLETCKKELATLFSHISVESGARKESIRGISEEWRQGLFWPFERGCHLGHCKGTFFIQGTYNICSGFIQDAYPCFEDKDYYGRGAIQLTYNYNYGYFSKIFFKNANVTLQNPELLQNNGTVAFASAIWFYMTPQYPKPSMHDVFCQFQVMSGFWKPNSHDKKLNITSGFGATTNIINGGIECGGGSNTEANKKRGDFFVKFMEYFGVKIQENNEIYCDHQKKFSIKGDGAVKQYWIKDDIRIGRCKLISQQTAYPIFVQDSYKDCLLGK